MEEKFFRKAWGKQVRFNVPSGSAIRPEYGYKINKKGQKELVKTGETDAYAEIQSYAEECMIENILKRVAAGDNTAFRPDGIYQDITEIPNNMNDAYAEMVKLEEFWNKQSTETKKEYGWSFENFMKEAGKESWLINCGLIEAPQPEKEPAQPVLSGGTEGADESGS